jgi:hypothetical protein
MMPLFTALDWPPYVRMSRSHFLYGFENLGQSEWASLVTDRVRAKEADHHQRRATLGITVLSRDGILRQDPFGCPSGLAPRFQMSPQVAAKNVSFKMTLGEGSNPGMLQLHGSRQRWRAYLGAHWLRAVLKPVSVNLNDEPVD